MKASANPMFQISLITIILATYVCPVIGQTVWFVAGDTGNNMSQGTSWGQAFETLDHALDNQDLEVDDQIWVKAGEYVPSTTFNLANRVRVFGGFVGTENNLNQRNFVQNVTTLSGNNGSINVVVTANDVLAQTELNGFTITGAAEHGIENIDSDARYENLLVENNGNASGEGGGASNNGGIPTFTSCIFLGNLANTGGAVINSDGTQARFDQCTFGGEETGQGNIAQTAGGAVYDTGANTYPSFVDCQFINNEVEQGGGGAIHHYKADDSDDFFLEIRGCTFRGNSADTEGGAIQLQGDQIPARILTSVFLDNHADDGGAIHVSAGLDDIDASVVACSFFGYDSDLVRLVGNTASRACGADFQSAPVLDGRQDACTPIRAKPHCQTHGQTLSIPPSLRLPIGCPLS